jgi:hypothetical protein
MSILREESCHLGSNASAAGGTDNLDGVLSQPEVFEQRSTHVTATFERFDSAEHTIAPHRQATSRVPRSARSSRATPTAFRQHAGIKSFAANVRTINSRARFPHRNSMLVVITSRACLRPRADEVVLCCRHAIVISDSPGRRVRLLVSENYVEQHRNKFGR